ncbi:hypothetical protein NQ314_002846 [Rhamnusium bicolor]|uniref:Cystinosin-like protein n=1 Tax=Rhamnusium bicolor TaxID=1586634 RepID=A0AAV8ZS21_9CUCU|nr:hypothetical protein NQ314_002846 [Rhamnusium bicolor]
MKPFARRKALLCALFTLISFIENAACEISVSTNDLTLKLNEKGTFYLEIRDIPETSAEIQIIAQHDDIVRINKTIIDLTNITNASIPIEVEAIGAGHSEIYANTTNNSTINVDHIFLRVTIYKVSGLATFSLVIGWIYFVAWSISFYPQIYINWKRRSVVGLNFDFIVLNIIGFTLYAVFNLGLYFIPEIKAYMNYKRKSTVGWSIGNIFLDFTGGALSMLQMIINAHNYNDWVSIFGDPTKFGLGLFSVAFDIFFIVQHYILYRHSQYETK